eukprot:symbB.v1.2.033623.t1/scaffold4205.1/size43098/2
MGLSRHGPLARFAVAVLAILLLGVQLPTFLQPTFGTRSPPPRGRSRRGADVDAKPREANVLSLSVLIVGAGPAGLLLADRLLSAGCSDWAFVRKELSGQWVTACGRRLNPVVLPANASSCTSLPLSLSICGPLKTTMAWNRAF